MVDVCCSFPKIKNIVRSLWVPSVDAIVDRRNCFFFFLSVMCGGSICCVFRVHSLGVAPRCKFSRVVRIDEVPCTDPLPLYVEFLTLRSYR